MKRVLKRRKKSGDLLKKCPAFLTIREVQTKTTWRFHVLPVRWLRSRTQLTMALVRIWGKKNSG